jgi:hypothetical protein
MTARAELYKEAGKQHRGHVSEFELDEKNLRIPGFRMIRPIGCG